MAEIFISEYIEGSSNNKAIEFYNPTGVAIDLRGWQLSA
jgi:predicted extracellular nuclease